MAQQYITKYRVEQRLGSGTFATVYRCFDPDLQSTCAIKVLAENWSADEKATSWFLNEARVMFGFEHPRILRVFTTGSLDDGRPFIVMEYADGGSLADIIRARRSSGAGFEIVEALNISKGIAEGLQAAHGRGLVHRDLKPSNILFRTRPASDSTQRTAGTPEVQIKLADFGLARTLEQGAASLAGAGTPHYMAPEQSRAGAEERPDVRSDIYAAATILYEMLAGRVPFPFNSITQVVNAHLVEEPPSIQELVPDIPRPVADLIHAGLAKEPNERVPDADEWARHIDALQSALAGNGSIADDHQLFSLPRQKPQHAPRNEAPTRFHPVGGAQNLTATRMVNRSDVELVAPGTRAPETRVVESSGTKLPGKVLAMIAIASTGLAIAGVIGFLLFGMGLGDNSGGSEDSDQPDSGVIAGDSERPTATAEPDSTPEPVEPTPPTERPTATPAPSPTATEVPPTPTPEPDLIDEEAREELAAILRGLPGLTSSLVLLNDGTTVGDSADRQVPSASIIKLWIAAAAYEQAAQGAIDLSEQRTVTGADQVFGTGILNQEQYVGRSISYLDLIEIMLLYSDNTAANLVIDLVGGLDPVNQYASEHGYAQTAMQRRLGELDPNRENYTSAQDVGLFLNNLIEGSVVDEATSLQIRETLERRAANEEDWMNLFGRNLPGDLLYGHIAGLLPDVRNEAGYYYSEELGDHVVIVALLGSLPDEGLGEEAIARAVQDIHERFP